MLFFAVLAHNPEHYQATLAEHRAEMLVELKQSGYPSDEAEAILNNPARIAQVMKEQSRHAGKVLAEHEQFILQLLITRTYDAFDRYSEELVRAIYRRWPTGVNGENIPTDELTKRLKQLTGNGTKAARSEALRDRLNLPWLTKPDEIDSETRIMGTRRIVTHNRAIIDDRFVASVAGFTNYSTTDVGTEIRLRPQEVLEDIAFLHGQVSQTDAQATAMYDLSPVSIPAMNPTDE